jgi:hypothetical protein
VTQSSGEAAVARALTAPMIPICVAGLEPGDIGKVAQNESLCNET